MIQQHVELDGPFGLTIGHPRKSVNAKFYQRCIQTVQFPFERKFMLRGNRLAVFQQHEEKFLENLRIPMLIGIRKIRPIQ